VGLLNVDGYYDSLLGLFDKSVEEGFVNPSARNIVVSARTARELIQRMEELPSTAGMLHSQHCMQEQELPSTAEMVMQEQELPSTA
ncbi:hypothetical protein H0E87_003600, partial [Populus deltoides]